MAIRKDKFFPSTVDTENLIVNGGFEVSQRYDLGAGGKQTLTANNKGKFFVDRWFVDMTETVSAVYSELDLAPLTGSRELPHRVNTYGGAQNALRLADSRGRFSIAQPIENARILYNRPFGWSFYVYADDDTTVEHTFRVSLIAGYRSGGLTGSTLTAQDVIIPNSGEWKWVAGKTLLGSPVGGQWWFFGDAGGEESNNDSFILFKVMQKSPALKGVTTPQFMFTGFRINGGDPQPYFGRPYDLELARCERFYETSFDNIFMPTQNTSGVGTAGAYIFKAGLHLINQAYSANAKCSLDIPMRYRTRKRYAVDHSGKVSPYGLTFETHKGLFYDLSRSALVSATCDPRWSGCTGFRVTTEKTSYTYGSVMLLHYVADYEYSCTAWAKAL